MGSCRRIRKDGTWSARGMAGRRVRLIRGRAWVTIEGDPHDHILGPGEDLVIPSPGRVAVQALEEACVQGAPLVTPERSGRS